MLSILCLCVMLSWLEEEAERSPDFFSGYMVSERLEK